PAVDQSASQPAEVPPFDASGATNAGNTADEATQDAGRLLEGDSASSAGDDYTPTSRSGDEGAASQLEAGPQDHTEALAVGQHAEAVADFSGASAAQAGFDGAAAMEALLAMAGNGTPVPAGPPADAA